MPVASPDLEQIKQETHLRGYTERTVKTYSTWITPAIGVARTHDNQPP